MRAGSRCHPRWRPAHCSSSARPTPRRDPAPGSASAGPGSGVHFAGAGGRSLRRVLCGGDAGGHGGNRSAIGLGRSCGSLGGRGRPVRGDSGRIRCGGGRIDRHGRSGGGGGERTLRQEFTKALREQHHRRRRWRRWGAGATAALAASAAWAASCGLRRVVARAVRRHRCRQRQLAQQTPRLLRQQAWPHRRTPAMPAALRLQELGERIRRGRRGSAGGRFGKRRQHPHWPAPGAPPEMRKGAAAHRPCRAGQRADPRPLTRLPPRLLPAPPVRRRPGCGRPAQPRTGAGSRVGGSRRRKGRHAAEWPAARDRQVEGCISRPIGQQAGLQNPSLRGLLMMRNAAGRTPWGGAGDSCCSTIS